MRLVEDFTFPKLGLRELALECRYMGQDLLNPPSVEGWHTGKEWIDTGSLVERINFAAQQVGAMSQAGRAARSSTACTRPVRWRPSALSICLDLAGPISVRQATRQALLDHVTPGGELRFATARGLLGAAGQRVAATHRGDTGISA